MIRTMLILLCLVVVVGLTLTGCDKNDKEAGNQPTASSEEPIKTKEEYVHEAEKEITKENAEEVLKTLEKELESDL